MVTHTSPAPSHHVGVFGAEAVHVLPLELLVEQGTATYLNRLCQMTGLEFSPAEAQNYLVHNASPPNDIVLNEDQRAIIRELSSDGNAFVAEQFGLPLRDLGYPMPAAEIVQVLRRTLAPLQRALMTSPVRVAARMRRPN